MRAEVKRSLYTTVSHAFDGLRTADVACNGCGGAHWRLLGREAGFDIRQCCACGLVYVSPQPVREDMARFYEGMYPEDALNPALRSLGYVEPHIRGIIARRSPQGGRLLEVGCGCGLLLERLADLPWRITALEMSARAADEARRRVPDAAIHTCGIEEAPFGDASFDCVVAVAVLEHLKDPRSAFTLMTRWLAPGGLLVLQVPYTAPYIRAKRWLPWIPVQFEAPRHLFDFAPRVLRRYFGEQRYRDVRAEVARPYASPNRWVTALIWGVKILSIATHALSGGRWIAPIAGAYVMHGVKPS